MLKFYKIKNYYKYHTFRLDNRKLTLKYIKYYKIKNFLFPYSKPKKAYKMNN
jgi:hypothetical protein